MQNEKDTLMRMLTFFLQKLAALLTKKNISEISDSEINIFYSEALGVNRDFVISLDLESLLSICKHDQVYCNEKCRILAELFYIETFRNDERFSVKNYAKKSVLLFDYYTQHTKTFDPEIISKKTQLSKIIENE